MISSKSFRDEENEKAGEVLTGLLSEELMPDLWRKKQREKVNNALEEILEIGLSGLYEISPDILLLKLKEKRFNAEQYENFGDLMLNIALVEPDHQKNLAKKAIFFYEYSQTESNTFSFGLIEKINNAKSLS
ncbi:MAG: hypothetical protein WB492_14140 [Christiangramia sp.]